MLGLSDFEACGMARVIMTGAVRTEAIMTIITRINNIITITKTNTTAIQYNR